jgi:hypothetical protein
MAPRGFLSPLTGLRNGNASLPASLPGAHAAGLIPDAPAGLRNSPVDSVSRHPHSSFHEPHPPTAGREGGGLRQEDLWRIEAVGAVSS